MPRRKATPADTVAEALTVPAAPTAPTPDNVGAAALAQAIREAIEASKPAAKKNQFQRKIGTPWTPKTGKKLKLKRKMFQHGLPLSEEWLSNEEIDLLNKIRPGKYGDGFIVVFRRRDRGVDIEYPIKTASQRLRLVNQFGIRNLSELCKFCITEAEKPKAPEFDEYGDAI